MKAGDVGVAETGSEVIVRHPDCLHEGVGDGGTDEAEAALEEVAAHGLGLGGARRNVSRRVPVVGTRASVHEGPQRISRISEVPLKEGMILSNEPGYYREGGMANLQTKRGCHYKCTFCAYPIIEGRGMRTRDPAGVYFGTRGGTVYGSRDAGKSWKAIAQGLPPVTCVKAALVGAA